MTHATEFANLLLSIDAVKLSVNPPFVWTSGIRTPIYCDNRLIISYPEERKKVIAGYRKLIEENNIEFDVIAGTATAAVPFASFLAYELNKPMVYIRHKSKDYGRSKQIEGKMETGARVLIIEDLISTGGSAIRSVESCKTEYDANVVAVLAVFTYEMKKAKQAFTETSIPLYTLSNFSTLVHLATEQGKLPSEQKDTVLSWSKNPEKWSENHGI